MPDDKQLQNTPVFRQEAPVFGHGEGDSGEEAGMTLREYLARHMEKALAAREAGGTGETESPASSEAVAKTPMSPVPEAYWLKSREPEKTGIQLNSLDTELSAGLEQYLPTPAVRLRIVKERLLREIGLLESEIRKYDTLAEATAPRKNPGPFLPKPRPTGLSGRQDLLRDKLHSLKTHEKRVDEELALLFSQSSWQSSWLYRCLTWMGEWKLYWQSVGGEASKATSLEGLFYRLDGERGDMARLNEELRDLSGLLEARLEDSLTPTPDQIGVLVNQYDRRMRKIEDLSERIRQRQGLREKLNQAISRFFEKLYS